MKKSLFMCLVLPSLFMTCTTNEVTERKQLSLLPESKLKEMSIKEYKSLLSQCKVVSTTTNKDTEMVRKVGKRIANAITEYYAKQGKGTLLSGYKWEFNLVDNKDANALCMPGGKVVVYTDYYR